MHTELLSENLRGRALEISGLRWEGGSKMDLGEIGFGGGGVWNGFIWLRIDASGGLL
jgi:hypothetical protein